MPEIRAGSSAHAAPDDAPADTAPEPAPIESDNSSYSNFSNYSDYSNFPDYQDFSAPAAPQPDYSSYSVPDPEPAYSPLSGPISYYDPLADRSAPEPPPLPEPTGYDNWSGGLDWPPTETPNGRNGHAAPGLEQPRSGRRRKPDPLDSDFALPGLNQADPGPAAAPFAETSAPFGEAPAPRGEGGRRRRFDPDDETTEVRPFRPDDAAQARRDSAPAWSPVPEPEPLPRNPGRAPGFDPMQAGMQAPPAMQQPPAAPPMSRSARRHVEAQRPVEAHEPESWHQQEPWQQDQSWQQDEPWRDERAAREDQFGRDDQFGREDQFGRNGRGGAPGGLPAWSARRRPVSEPAAHDEHDRDADSERGWSLAEQDQQLLSGETVAGDLLRDAVDREDERAERDSRRAGKRRAGGSRRRGKGGLAVAEPEHNDRYTDEYDPVDDHDDYDDEPEPSLARRLSAAATRLTSRVGRAPARSRAPGRSEEDENRRQWLVLAGQSAGAAVAGMLLFKGFERMWEVLPWVALMLAMIVILGLVALVRVLRRTDDIFSTVIAVVVGVFVTLGPLAFLLSTN